MEFGCGVETYDDDEEVEESELACWWDKAVELLVADGAGVLDDAKDECIELGDAVMVLKNSCCGLKKVAPGGGGGGGCPDVINGAPATAAAAAAAALGQSNMCECCAVGGGAVLVWAYKSLE